MPSENKKIMNI